MYQKSFGTNGQVQFENENEYYQLIGYLSKSDGSSSIVWEHNEEQGAWASEGRIQFFTPIPRFFHLQLTAGVGNIWKRVNCNEFVENLRADHHFVIGNRQNIDDIRSTIPVAYMADFEMGLTL